MHDLAAIHRMNNTPALRSAVSSQASASSKVSDADELRQATYFIAVLSGEKGLLTLAQNEREQLADLLRSAYGLPD